MLRRAYPLQAKPCTPAQLTAAQAARACPVLRAYSRTEGCWLAVRRVRGVGYVCSLYWQGMHHSHYTVHGARSAAAALRAFAA